MQAIRCSSNDSSHLWHLAKHLLVNDLQFKGGRCENNATVVPQADLVPTLYIDVRNEVYPCWQMFRYEQVFTTC